MLIRFKNEMIFFFFFQCLWKVWFKPNWSEPTAASLTSPNQCHPPREGSLMVLSGEMNFPGLNIPLHWEKSPTCWRPHLYPGWFPQENCSFMGFAWTQHSPAPTLQRNETLFNRGNNMFRIFSPEQLLYCNLGAFEATTTNGIRGLEVYSLCKAQLAVVYDEVHRKSGKNLDGSSNTDVLKMKACSAIKCLNKVFWY